ncbi:MAG TPA: hypothetical protein VF228_15980 [Iamia sp.]
MAKQHGLGMDLLIGGYRLGNDVGSISNMSSPVGQQVVTGLDKSAFERICLLRDGMMSFEPFFNPDEDRIHEVLSALPRGDLIVSALVGTAQGAPVYSLSGKQNNYDGSRGADGALTFATTMTGNGWGADWGEILSEGITTSTAAEDLTSVDGAAASAFGLQAYLHLIDFDGTDIDVVIEDSADNATFLPITGAAFTTATAIGAERIHTARDGAVRRYTRVAVSGTFTTATYVVAVNRNVAVAPL